MNEKTVGDKRKFQFSNKDYEIREIIENPNNKISLVWRWEDSICPHCKHRQTKETNHLFYRIEVLCPYNEEVTRENLILLGYTIDNRLMMLPIEKYDEVLSYSKGYENLKKTE